MGLGEDAPGSTTLLPARSQRAVSAPRARAVATALMTILVVAAGSALGTIVYHRAGPVRDQRIAAASLTGRLAAATSGSVLPQVSAQLTRLSQDGVPTRELAGVRSAAAALTAHPRDPARLTALRSASGALSTQLANRQHIMDAEAEVSYAVLFILTSLAWLAGFRRLTSSNRSLQRKVAEQEAAAARVNWLATLARRSSAVVAVVDPDSTVSFVTPSAQVVLGWDPGELIGQSLLEAVVAPEDRRAITQLLVSHHDGEERLALHARHRSGRELFLEGTLTSRLDDPTVGGLVVSVQDVTERHELEELLAQQAFRDPLTGLANRQLFADRLGHALTRKGRVGERGTVVLLFDLDNFKQINDSAGHHAGDAVLSEVSKRLTDVVRTSDTAARLGGDEFVVLMEDSGLDEARVVAKRLGASLARPIFFGGAYHVVQASIGLAEATGDLSAEDVLRNADMAMYLAKDRGKAGIAVYEDNQHGEALQEMQLQIDLQGALRLKQLVLHYQPAVDLETGAIAGFEALMRWEHPVRGLLAPAHFIPLAEETGLILPLGRWALYEACRAAAAMQSEGRSPTMSVNVSAAQLDQPDFVDGVFAVLEQTGLPADRLCLEITESSVLGNLASVVPMFERLRGHGVRIAVDDFGTGYSSLLSSLARLPVDILKVDKSFVDSITENGYDTAVIEAILAMSAALRLTTIAKGIESPAQLRWLASARCTLGQGFLWSRPVPLEQARALLATFRLAPDPGIATGALVALEGASDAASEGAAGVRSEGASGVASEGASGVASEGASAEHLPALHP